MLLKKLESIKSTGKHWIKYLSTDEKKELLTKVPHLNIEINGVGEFMCCLREGISKQVVCIACGGPTKYNPAKKTYSPFCSTDCRWSDKGKAHSQKVKEKSNLEKYGVKNVNQLGDVKDLKKKRSLEKYGTEHPNQHKDIREKISESRKGSRGETYKRLVDENGGEHPRCPVCGTSLEFNSGKCEFYTFCSEECKTSPEGKAYSKAIRDSTNMERYGTTIPGQRKEAKIKRKKTNLERYGSECVFGNDEIKERLAKTQRNNFWDTFIILLEQKKVQPLFTKEDYIEGSTSKKKYKCLMCNSNFSTGAVHPQNIYCTCHSNRSLKEEEVAGWIESLGIDIQRNFRIGKKEIDMYLPKYNLGIEFNGIYWHSEAYRGEYYHQDKYKLCLEHGIGLIQIFENEWEFKRDIVKSLVLSRLGILPKVLYARKCIIKELDNSTYKKFVIKNHLNVVFSSQSRKSSLNKIIGEITSLQFSKVDHFSQKQHYWL